MFAEMTEEREPRESREGPGQAGGPRSSKSVRLEGANRGCRMSEWCLSAPNALEAVDQPLKLT